MAKNICDFLLEVSMNPVLGIEFLENTETIEQLKSLCEQVGIENIPGDGDCLKILNAKKNLVDNIDDIGKLMSIDRTKY